MKDCDDIDYLDKVLDLCRFPVVLMWVLVNAHRSQTCIPVYMLKQWSWDPWGGVWNGDCKSACSKLNRISLLFSRSGHTHISPPMSIQNAFFHHVFLWLWLINHNIHINPVVRSLFTDCFRFTACIVGSVFFPETSVCCLSCWFIF